MWQTSCGDRVLQGDEAALLKASVTSLAEQIREESSEFGTQWQHGVELFDCLTWTQRLALLEQVATHLLTPTPRTLQLSAVNEAAIAVLFENVRAQVDLETLGIQEGQTHWRQLVLNAYRESFPEELECDEESPHSEEDDFEYEPQTVHCNKRDLWRNAIEALMDRILWDRDYEMTADFIDQPPEHAEFLRSHMGIDSDYFASAAPDIMADDQLASTIERISDLTSVE